MNASEEIAKSKLNELDFRRWRLLMRKIDDFEVERRELSDQMRVLNKKSTKLYAEMLELWEHAKK